MRIEREGDDRAIVLPLSFRERRVGSLDQCFTDSTRSQGARYLRQQCCDRILIHEPEDIERFGDAVADTDRNRSGRSGNLQCLIHLIRE
jgi:homoaconitase/3-isopropylmalate dehydratase large subunit